MRWVFVCLLLVACTSSYVELDGSISLEIADTLDEQMRGLMYRSTLGRNSGMLFVYSEEAPRAFWMKNTKIPLDMIFMDSNFKVLTIHRDVPPCVTDACEQYVSREGIQYVLEVNAGRASSLKVNDTLRVHIG